jgi:hypothetical protein
MRQVNCVLSKPWMAKLLSIVTPSQISCALSCNPLQSPWVATTPETHLHVLNQFLNIGFKPGYRDIPLLSWFEQKTPSEVRTKTSYPVWTELPNTQEIIGLINSFCSGWIILLWAQNKNQEARRRKGGMLIRHSQANLLNVLVLFCFPFIEF